MTVAPGRAAGAGDRPSATALLGYWIPAAVYIAIIFSLSSIRGTNLPSGFPNMDKLAHLLEYALLGLLLGRAIRFTMAGRGRLAASLATVVAGALVGLADEFYQRAIPGRSSDIRDWVVDVLAVSASVALTQWVSTRPLRAQGAASRGEEPR